METILKFPDVDVSLRDTRQLTGLDAFLMDQKFHEDVLFGFTPSKTKQVLEIVLSKDAKNNHSSLAYAINYCSFNTCQMMTNLGINIDSKFRFPEDLKTAIKCLSNKGYDFDGETALHATYKLNSHKKHDLLKSAKID